MSKNLFGSVTGTDETAGEIISRKTLELLEEWDCVKNVKCMVFDTTSANTGHVTAACVSIQEKLDRCLFWCGCCHHVGELIIHHVFTNLKIEASKSPEVSLFIRLRDHWELLSKDCVLDHMETESLTEEAKALIERLKSDLFAVYNAKHEFLREDYKELLLLAVAYVDKGTEHVSFRRPGALHKARWMSKLIYTFKLVLLESQIDNLPKGTITSDSQVPKLRDFALFIAEVYCPWWFECSKSLDAPWNTLKL